MSIRFGPRSFFPTHFIYTRTLLSVALLHKLFMHIRETSWQDSNMAGTRLFRGVYLGLFTADTLRDACFSSSDWGGWCLGFGDVKCVSYRKVFSDSLLIFLPLFLVAYSIQFTFCNTSTVPRWIRFPISA